MLADAVLVDFQPGGGACKRAPVAEVVVGFVCLRLPKGTTLESQTMVGAIELSEVPVRCVMLAWQVEGQSRVGAG